MRIQDSNSALFERALQDSSVINARTRQLCITKRHVLTRSSSTFLSPPASPCSSYSQHDERGALALGGRVLTGDLHADVMRDSREFSSLQPFRAARRYHASARREISPPAPSTTHARGLPAPPSHSLLQPQPNAWLRTLFVARSRPRDVLSPPARQLSELSDCTHSLFSLKDSWSVQPAFAFALPSPSNPEFSAWPTPLTSTPVLTSARATPYTCYDRYTCSTVGSYCIES